MWREKSLLLNSRTFSRWTSLHNKNKYMPELHHIIVLNTVNEYGSYGVTCCFCASDMAISNEFDKLI